MGESRVGIGAVVGARVGVNRGVCEPGYLVQEGVAGLFGDGVTGGHAEVVVHDDVGFPVETVTDPSQSDCAHRFNARDVAQHVLGAVDQLGVDGIHEAVKHLAGGASQHGEDRECDQQADNRIGPVEPGGDPGGAEDDGEGREAVGAGVKSVRHQRGRSDAAEMAIISTTAMPARSSARP
jgi:hypothetical protein